LLRLRGLSFDFVVYKPNMCNDVSIANPYSFPFWLETLSIFLGDVLATIFIGGTAYISWYVAKYPGFRVGANWSFAGWDAQRMGRLPSEADTGTLQLMPNIAVTCRDATVKKVIVAVWVRERKDLHNPGEIHGFLDLKKAGVPVDARTTGGDVLNLYGPTIVCEASKFQRIFRCPVFIQTSDGELYQAESPGNNAKGIVKLRYDLKKLLRAVKPPYQVREFLHAAKVRVLGRRG
jgi:hypothetical protein